MSYCSKCGHKIEIEAEYCPKCGNALEKEPVTKEPVRASRQDTQQISDSNEVRAIQFDMKNAKNQEIGWSIGCVLFFMGGLLPLLFCAMGRDEFWFCIVLVILGVLFAAVATIFSSKVSKCKKELIRLGGSPK